MNQNFNQLQGRFPGIGCWLTILIAFWVIGAIGITGILKSIFALVLFLVLAPVLAFGGLQFWIKRNLVEGNCPVCEQPLAGLKNFRTPCPNCGTEVMATAEGFARAAADGIIDIQAVDVQATDVDATNVEDNEGEILETALMDTTPIIDVEVQQLPDADV